MTFLSDTNINSAIRRLLVQHWIDLGALSIRTTRGVVTLSGALVKLRDSRAVIGQEELEGIRLAIQRCPGVRRLQLDLSNIETPNPGPMAESTEHVALAQPYRAERSLEIQ